MLNIQELANFITEKLNIISTTKNAGYVFDIYAENGKGKDDGSIKGVVKSLSNNPLVVKSLASVKTIYRVELATPNGMDNKNLVKIEDIISEFVKTYEGTQQTFTGGVGSFELTYAHLAENYAIKNEIGGIVPLQFEMTVNFTDNGLLGSSKTWLLNGVEIPYLNEVILLSKEGQTNRISKEKYNKTIVLAQTKYYKFTIPFDKTNTVCTTLQADLLNGDFSKTYTLEYYDGVTYTQENPFMTTVSLFQSGDSGSDGAEISKFTVTFADVSAAELTPKYTLELFSTPFDEKNIRYFDSVDEQTAWYDALPHAPAVQIKAPNLNTVANTTQVYDFSGMQNFPYSPIELANMNVARINEKTDKTYTEDYRLHFYDHITYTGEIQQVGGDVYTVPYEFVEGADAYTRVNIEGTNYSLKFESGEPAITDGGGDEVEVLYDQEQSIYYFNLTYPYTVQRDNYNITVKDWNGTVVAEIILDLTNTDPQSAQFTIVNGETYSINITKGNVLGFIAVSGCTINNSQGVYAYMPQFIVAQATGSFEIYIRYNIETESSHTEHFGSIIPLNDPWHSIPMTKDPSNPYWYFTLKGVNYVVVDTGLGYNILVRATDEPIAENLDNDDEFSIEYPIGAYHYYYKVQSAEIGANNQIILTLNLDTLQTYLVNEKVKFSECFINKAHLNRFVYNGDGTISFNGGVESPLFEREEVQNVSKRLVAREVLNYDYGQDHENEPGYSPALVDQLKRVEKWYQNNVVGWLYGFFPVGQMSCYPIVSGEQDIKAYNFPGQRYRTFVGGDTIDANFIVFACPIYSGNKKIIFHKDNIYLHIHKDYFMDYLQKRLSTGSNPQPLAYTLKFSTKPPIERIDEFLMGFDVNNEGDLESINNSTQIRGQTGFTNAIISSFDLSAIRTSGDVVGSAPGYMKGCFVCEGSLLPTIPLEDYIIINPTKFPIFNDQYIEKVFYRINNYKLTQDVPQNFNLTRPGVNIEKIGVKVQYGYAYVISQYTTFTTTDQYVTHYIKREDKFILVTMANRNEFGINPGTTVAYGKATNIGSWEIDNTKGEHGFGDHAYKLKIKESSMEFAIQSLPELEQNQEFLGFDYVDFIERIYGIVGANKNPIYNPKLLNSDYRSLRLTNERGGQFEYDIQKLNTEILKTASTEQITADLQRNYFRAVDTDGVYQSECSQNLTGLVDSSETSMPLATDAWRKTLAEQPNFFAQRNVEHLKSALGAGFAGFLGGGSNIGLSGGIKGGLVGAMVGMGISAINSVIGDYFSDDNMDKQPAMVQNANGNVIFNLSYTKPGMTIEQYALLPQEERIINDQMFANGYTYNRIDQIRNFTHTRKYFNTIMAMVETISGVPLSNEVRDDIKQRLANGVRLWHTDEIQYEKENYELWLEE